MRLGKEWVVTNHDTKLSSSRDRQVFAPCHIHHSLVMESDKKSTNRCPSGGRRDNSSKDISEEELGGVVDWQWSHRPSRRPNGDYKMDLVEIVWHIHSLIIESDDKSTRKCSSEARRDYVSKEMGTEDGDLVDCQQRHHINGNVGPKDRKEKTKRWIWTS